jgi:hypothetical protein
MNVQSAAGDREGVRSARNTGSHVAARVGAAQQDLPKGREYTGRVWLAGQRALQLPDVD